MKLSNQQELIFYLFHVIYRLYILIIVNILLNIYKFMKNPPSLIIWSLIVGDTFIFSQNVTKCT